MPHYPCFNFHSHLSGKLLTAENATMMSKTWRQKYERRRMTRASRFLATL
jgi:hypothetical protein